MKKWVTPELLELRTEWTQNHINSAGYDMWGEHTDEGFELGSTCC